MWYNSPVNVQLATLASGHFGPKALTERVALRARGKTEGARFAGARKLVNLVLFHRLRIRPNDF